MGFFQALAKVGTDMAVMVAEDGAMRDAAPGKSQEFWRAVRANKAQQADVLSRGAQQAGRIRAEASMLEGTQQVAFALSGVDSSSGTPGLVMDSSSRFAELDAATTMANARREALGLKRAERNLYAEANAAAVAQKNKDIANVVKMGTSFLDLGAAAVSPPKGGGK